MPVGPRERKVAQFAFEEYHKQEGESDECQFETFKVNEVVVYLEEYHKQEGESDDVFVSLKHLRWVKMEVFFEEYHKQEGRIEKLSWRYNS